MELPYLYIVAEGNAFFLGDDDILFAAPILAKTNAPEFDEARLVDENADGDAHLLAAIKVFLLQES